MGFSIVKLRRNEIFRMKRNECILKVVNQLKNAPENETCSIHLL